MKPAKSIPRISPIHKTKFFKEYVSLAKPVIIEGLVDEWPAFGKWSMQYFAERYAKVAPVTVKVKDGKHDFDLEHGTGIFNKPMEETLKKIMAGNVSEGYAIGTTDEVFPQELRDDYPTPGYCADGKYLRARIFIGAKGTITETHQDLFENLYTVVKGSKRIYLFEPKDSIYPNSRFSKLPNFARTDPENPDYENYPKMRNAQPYVVDLKAGETLFLPSLWWHYVKNQEESIAVSYWWAYGWKLPLVWAAVQYKKFRGI